MAWDDNLDGKALEIASCNKSPLRVVAGPGTGKTFALMRRVARLLEEGIDPKKILLVTLTRVAAHDLEKELGRLNIQNAALICKGTLHAFCFSILGQADALKITRRVPRPLFEYEERFLLEDLDCDEGFGNYHQRGRMLKAFEAAWAREQKQEPNGPNNNVERRFEGELGEWLRFHQAILLAELIPLTLDYLNGNPASPERSRFAHVLVDEYQDLNRAEQRLIDLLSERGALTIIGDEDQSIYEDFRFAHPEGISEFNEDHAGTYDIPLSECRRCPTRVVEIAAELIKNNRRRKGHELLPRTANDEGNLHVVQWRTMEEEAAGIAKFVHDMIQRGEFDPGKILILCPRREFGYGVRNALTALGHPAHSFFHEEELDGNPKAAEDCRAQEAFTLLTLLVKPEDIVALRCWLGFGCKSLRRTEWQSLRQQCAWTGISPKAALDEMSQGLLSSVQNATGLIVRYNLLLEHLANLKQKSGQALLDAVFPPGQDWAEPFRTIVGNLPNDLTAEKMFEVLSDHIAQPELPTEVEYIRIMSLHKSKGLTADHVIVTGCIEGLIPKRKEDGVPPEEQTRYVEEQRRLFYVAITRPKKTLVLSSVLNLPRGFARKWGVPVPHRSNGQFASTITSDFVSELRGKLPRPVLGDEWKY